uniref:Uncharacterized protein n=1 Tax=Micrurus spixii TaxID=129469 RepID=A0A2D4LM24_9SAUR
MLWAHLASRSSRTKNGFLFGNSFSVEHHPHKKSGFHFDTLSESPEDLVLPTSMRNPSNGLFDYLLSPHGWGITFYCFYEIFYLCRPSRITENELCDINFLK